MTLSDLSGFTDIHWILRRYGKNASTSSRLVALVLLVAAVALPSFTGCSKPVKGSPKRGLAISPWPKYGAGLTNDSLSTASPSPAWKFKWQAKVPDGFTGQPAIGSDGSVYFNVGQEYVYCFDGKTGAQKWMTCNVASSWKRRINAFVRGKNSAGQISENHFSICTSSPALSENGTLYMGSRDGNLYALDAKTGARIWRRAARIVTKSSYGDETAAPGSPTIGRDGTVYFMCSGVCYAVDGSNGGPIWSFDCKSNVCSAPAIGIDGTVYALSGDDVYALDPRSGAARWHFASPSGAPDPWGGELAVGRSGSVYFCDSSGACYALDCKTGKSRWKVSLRQPVAQTGPVIGLDGTVYVMAVNGEFAALDGATGREKWTKRYGFKGQSVHPAVGGDGTIYLNGLDDKNIRCCVILAIDPKSGSVAHKFELGGSSNLVPNPPAIGGDGTIYTGSIYGHIDAIR